MNCPHCHRLLYSRQHKKCGYCGEVLPEEILITSEEMASLKAEQQAIYHRHEVARDEEQEERERQREEDSRAYIPLG